MSPAVQMSPVDRVVYGKRSPVPGCNTLAYRKGNYHFLIRLIIMQHSKRKSFDFQIQRRCEFLGNL